MISIPEAVWDLMLDRFADERRGVERVAYLDGVRWVDRGGVTRGVVTTVVLPDATLTPGYYRVSAEANAEAGLHTIDVGLVRLAQVHTHGNDWTSHSDVDDRMAYTRREGGLSIVLPRHASRRPRPEEGGVHLRRGAEWQRIAAPQIADVVRILPSELDLRRRLPTKGWRWLPWNR